MIAKQPPFVFGQYFFGLRILSTKVRLTLSEKQSFVDTV